MKQNALQTIRFFSKFKDDFCTIIGSVNSDKMDAFGYNEDERLTKYDADLYALNEVYARELAAAEGNKKYQL